MKTKLTKLVLLVVIVFLTLLPFYLLRDYMVAGYKILNPNYSNLKSKNGLTSVLILGKGGEGHTAPDLTDTIINVFISANSKKISTLSLPRDIWIPEIRAKINSSYYWDKQRNNSDYSYTRSSAGAITGINPDYIVVVDFNMFEDLVNSLGGVKVDVENSFVDKKFPIPGRENDLCDGDRSFSCRYETISFEKGAQLMDGDTALKFVRSRNSEGDEGTDLAREVRQQKVIDAIVDKTLSGEILLNPKKLAKLSDSVFSNIETDIDENAIFVLARLLYDSKQNVQNLTILEDYLEVSNGSYLYDFQYVFVPKNGSWKEFSTNLQNQIY